MERESSHNKASEKKRETKKVLWLKSNEERERECNQQI